MSDETKGDIEELIRDIPDEIINEIAEAPRYSCTLAGAYASVLASNRVIPILHSGSGCGFGQWFSLALGSGNAGPVGKYGACAAPCSSLLEEHVIFGGEEKLRDLIESTIELMDGDLFVVIPGCIPSLIGDDVEAVVSEFREQVPIINLDTAGFKGNSFDGYEAYFQAIIDQLLHDVQPETEDNLVNIFGITPAQHVFYRGDLQAIKNLLKKIGVEANVFFSEEEGLDSLKKIPSAKYNIVLSPWVGLNIVEKLKEKFGTEYVVFPSSPIGPKQSSEFLQKVGKLLEIPDEKVNAVIEKEENTTFKTYEYIADPIFLLLPNAYFAVAADTGMAIGITKYLTNEPSYIPDVIVITDNPPEEYHERIISELNEIQSDIKPEVIFEKDSHKIREILNNRKFQFLFASSLEKYLAESEFHAPHLSVSYPVYDRLVVDRSYTGYRGGFALLEDALSKFSGPC